jgi:hypothetical protein
MNREEMFANYHYRRGYLDGSGNGDRAHGKTGRNILDAVMTASETKSDVFFVCDNDRTISVEKRKVMDISQIIGFDFCNRMNMFEFENGSTIWFVSKQNIRGAAESMLGCHYLSNPVVILDIDMTQICCRTYDDIGEFKYMIQARTR